MVVGPSLILSLTLLATLVMAATKPPKSKTFPLRQLPSVPLMHILRLLPHSALATLAATCSFYHATLHSSPSLWRRLTLLPTVLARSLEAETDGAAIQSFRAMLRSHGRHVTAVRIKRVEWSISLQGQLGSSNTLPVVEVSPLSRCWGPWR